MLAVTMCEVWGKEEGPCPCYSYSIATFATSSIKIMPCFSAATGCMKRRGLHFRVEC